MSEHGDNEADVSRGNSFKDKKRKSVKENPCAPKPHVLHHALSKLSDESLADIARVKKGNENSS